MKNYLLKYISTSIVFLLLFVFQSYCKDFRIPFNGLDRNTVEYVYSSNNIFINEIEGFQDETIPSAPVIKGQDITVSLDENGNATITPEDIDTGTTDPDGMVTLSIDKNSFNCENLGRDSRAITPILIGSETQSTHGYGGGFNPNTNEFWYPMGALPYVKRYDRDHIYLGIFPSDQSHMYQLWMDADSETDYYTANWENFTITKRTGDSTIWSYSYNYGDYASGVSTDTNFVYAIGWGENQIKVLDKNTGAFINSISLSGNNNISVNGGLVVSNGYIYLVGFASDGTDNDDSWYYVHQYDMDGNYIASHYNGGIQPLNTAFDGETIWYSNNSSTIHGMKISDGSAYRNSESNAVTLTATDPLGNSSSETFMVTVEDNLSPTIVGQDISVTLSASGTVSISPEDVLESGSDNCTPVTYTISQDIFGEQDAMNSPVIIELTGSDENGNSTVVPVEVTVIDPTKIPPPDTTAPVAICKDITIQLNDAGVVLITGADIDGGSNDASGIASLETSPAEFGCDNIGENQVVLNVTDNNGNSSTCIAVVTVIGIIPEVNITQSDPPEFGQGAVLLLTANSDEAIAYDWSTGADTQVIEVTVDGFYGVMVTSATNCTAFVEYEVSGIDTGELISSYTLIATEEIHLHGKNTVYSGAVGVIKKDKKVKIHEDSHVVGLVQASEIEIKNGSTVGSKIYLPATPEIPEFVYNDKSKKQSTNVKVKKNTTITLSEEIYGKIEIDEGATVIFEASNIYINEIKIKKGVKIEFVGCARLYVNKTFKLEENCTINSTGNSVVIFVDDKVEVNRGSDVTARIYANNNDILVKGNKDALTTMNGIFIGKKIHGDKNVSWNMDRFYTPCEVPDPYLDDCNECKGGITELTLQYNGIDGAEIVVENKKGETLYSGFHLTGDQFIFNGLGKDNKMSSYIYLFVDGNAEGDLHVSCSKPIGTGQTVGDFEIIAGLSKDNGSLCEIEPEYIFEDDCGECKGGLIELTLQYNGANNKNVVVKNKAGIDLFKKICITGEQFTFVGLAKDNKMSSYIYLYVDDTEVGSLHVSCSKPIGTGMVVGDFEIVSGISKENGPLCEYVPVETKPHHKSAEITSVIPVPQNSLSVQMYPNPSSGTVNLDFGTTKIENAEIIVMSITGQEVFRKKYRELGKIQFDLSEHISGVYMVIMKIDNNRIVRKLILRDN